MRRIEFLAAQATSIPTSWAFGTSSAEADPIILTQTLVLKIDRAENAVCTHHSDMCTQHRFPPEVECTE
jgi:hypothetical protein